MHAAFHTRGHGVDHWVFEPSFPSFLLPYHSETMGFNVFFDNIYFDRYLRLGRYLDIIVWFFSRRCLASVGIHF